MKLYIRSSNTKNPLTFRIYVDVYLSNPNRIAATVDYDKFDPVSNADGTVNPKALRGWELFVQRVALQLSPIFKTVNIDRSPVERSLTSRYFWVYGRNDDGTINAEILLRLRISDHDYLESHDPQSEFDPVSRLGQALKPPDKIKGQNIEVAEITVQSEQLGVDNSYDTYTKAVKAIDSMARQIKEEYLDDRYLNGGEPQDDWGEDFKYEPHEYTQEEMDTFTKNYRKSHGLPEK